MSGPLIPDAPEGIRVIDCSRILAGPMSSRARGDLEAGIVGIARPGLRDDIRRSGPAFLTDADGNGMPA